MSQSHPVANATRFGVVLLLVSFAIAGFAASPAEAQLNVYKLEGVVYSPQFAALKDATVTVYTMAGAKQASATSDAAGKYAIASLPSGKYNLSVTHAAYKPSWVPVEIAGTDPTVQQNFVMSSGGGTGPLVLKGIVKDEASGKALANVRIELWNYPDRVEDASSSHMPYRESQQSAVTGADGAYAFNVDAGSVNLNARLDGYDVLHANFHMAASRSLDLPMRSAEGGVVKVTGHVKGSDGKAIPNAWINVQPDYECEGDVCTAEASQPREAKAPDGDVYFYYEPANQPWASTQSDENGKFSLQTTSGRRVLTAHADQHLENRTKFTAEDGETETINMVLERMPPDSVRVSGKVIDAKTGKGIPYAQVNLENQRWGHWNYTQTKDDGSYEFYTKPGYTIVTASAERYYYIPCAQPAQDKIAPGEPYPTHAPCPDGGQQERDVAYYSRIQVLAGDQDAYPLDIKLQPRPAPTAEFKGYIVNASSQKAIPGVQVQFFNEYTHDWGSATTDADGSFRIQVHGGYYTIRAWAEHYFDGVLNVEVQDGQSLRVDVELTPGEKRYGGGCCWTYATAAMDGGSSSPKAAGGPVMTTATMGGGSGAMPESDRAASGGSGDQVYAGEGGGLGPYQPFTGDQGKGGGTAPGAGIGLALAALLAVLIIRRRER